MNIITVDSFLDNAKKLKKNDKIKIYIKELDGEVEFDKLSRADYLDLIVDNKGDKDAEIIYYCCPLLRDERLINTLQCKHNPVDVVSKALQHATITTVAGILLKELSLIHI